jgi:hypothetical protein
MHCEVCSSQMLADQHILILRIHDASMHFVRFLLGQLRRFTAIDFVIPQIQTTCLEKSCKSGSRVCLALVLLSSPYDAVCVWQRFVSMGTSTCAFHERDRSVRIQPSRTPSHNLRDKRLLQPQTGPKEQLVLLSAVYFAQCRPMHSLLSKLIPTSLTSLLLHLLLEPLWGCRPQAAPSSQPRAARRHCLHRCYRRRQQRPRLPPRYPPPPFQRRLGCPLNCPRQWRPQTLRRFRLDRNPVVRPPPHLPHRRRRCWILLWRHRRSVREQQLCVWPRAAQSIWLTTRQQHRG